MHKKLRFMVYHFVLVPILIQAAASGTVQFVILFTGR